MKTLLLLTAMCCVCLALPFNELQQRKKTPITETKDSGGLLTAPKGVITSPNFPNNYPNNANCHWNITTASRFKITFTNFDIEGFMFMCGFDKLQIYNKDYQQDFCGQMLPHPIISSQKTMQIVLTSDKSITRTGFRITYEPDTSSPPTILSTTTTTTRTTTTEAPTTSTTTKPTTVTKSTTTIAKPNMRKAVPGCGGLLTAPRGVITSPNFPNIYPDNILCHWNITTTSKFKIIFTNFDIEGLMFGCGFDKLQIYNKDYQQDFCGQMLPPPIISSQKSMQVTFTSDGSIHRTGFRITYEPV